MKTAELQHRALPNQSAALQKGGAAMASSQSGRLTQLEALIDASPAMVTQRKLIDAIASSAFSKMQSAAPLQAKLATLQRLDDEDEKLGTAQRAVKEEELDLSAQSTAQLQEASTPKANNTGLPDNLKSGIETLSGISMDSVKVHYNSPQPAQLNALAYAQGSDIHVAPGQEQHLPHEAWHVVQQAQGRVKPTLQMKGGVPVNDDKALEQEADVMGAMALQMKVVGQDATASNTAMDVWPLPELLTLGDAPAQRRASSTMNQGGACSCSNCSPSRSSVQLKKSDHAAALIQLKTTVSITDGGITKDGESGNESRARKYIGEWPDLQRSFESIVHPVNVPKLDEEGQDTGKLYERNGYMCAEPYAFGLLLHAHDRSTPNHALADDFVSKVSFPALAVDDKTGGSIKPCPVCAQWVTANAPMTINALGAPAMRNKKGMEAERERQRLATIEQEEQAERQRVKEQKKEGKKAEVTAQSQKTLTIVYLQENVAQSDIFQALDISAGRKKKKDPVINTNDLLNDWINSLATTNPLEIELYKKFDDGHKEEFKIWYSENH